MRYNATAETRDHATENTFKPEETDFQFDASIPGLQRFLDYKQDVIGHA